VTLKIVQFDREHLAGAMALFHEEGWRTFYEAVASRHYRGFRITRPDPGLEET
jgi:hypothetical protein